MTNPLTQRYWKAREQCALFHLEDWWVVRVKGKDSRDFLQRLGTADIRPLQKGNGCQTLFLGGDGRIVADAVALCVSDTEFLLICVAACGEKLVEQLDRFLFSEDVELGRLDSDTYIGLITGPATDRFIGRVLEINTADNESFVGTARLADEVERGIVVLRSLAFENLRGEIYRAVEEVGGVVGDSDLYNILRIEAGLPEFGKDLTHKTIPLDARLKPAISFTKGCFPGQEIVARINNLGHPANALVGLLLPVTTKNLIGCELEAEGKLVGAITSVGYSPALNRVLGLGYTKWNFREIGLKLDVKSEENFTAEIVELPIGSVR